MSFTRARRGAPGYSRGSSKKKKLCCQPSLTLDRERKSVVDDGPRGGDVPGGFEPARRDRRGSDVRSRPPPPRRPRGRSSRGDARHGRPRPRSPGRRCFKNPMDEKTQTLKNVTHPSPRRTPCIPRWRSPRGTWGWSTPPLRTCSARRGNPWDGRGSPAGPRTSQRQSDTRQPGSPAAGPARSEPAIADRPSNARAPSRREPRLPPSGSRTRRGNATTSRLVVASRGALRRARATASLPRQQRG